MAKTTTPKNFTKKTVARLERERTQQKYLRIAALVIIILVVGVIGFGILDQTVLLKNKAIAKVDNQSINVQQFQKQVEFTRWQLIQQYTNTLQLMQFFGQDPNMAQQFQSSLTQIQSQLDEQNKVTLGSTVVDQMIDDKVIRFEAQSRNIDVSDDEIEKSLQEAFNYYPNGTPTSVPTAEPQATSTLSALQLTMVPLTATPAEPTATAEATATLQPAPTVDPSLPTATPFPTPTPYTVEGFQGQVKNYVDQLKSFNYSEADLREVFRQQLYYDKLFKEITADVKPEEDQVWARHILVQDEATAQEVLNKIKEGQDWVALAAEYSQDTSNKDNGGDLGWFGKGQMVEEFETAALGLQIGQISDPVKSQFGYHIIQVLGHEMRPVTSQQLQTLKTTTFNTWLEEAKKNHVIEKYDNWMDLVPVEPTLSPDLLR